MKASRLIGLLLPAVLLLAACAPKAPAGPSGAASTELNLYAWSEYVPQQLLDDFTAQHGIKVNYDTYSSNQEMLAVRRSQVRLRVRSSHSSHSLPKRP